MRLTWRDGAATLLAGFVVVVAFAVTQAWGWPLLGDYRAGVVVLAVTGIAMCAVGSRPWQTSPMQDPVLVLTMALGVLAMGLVIYGIVVASVESFVLLATVLVAQWVVTTARHALTAPPDLPARTAPN